MKTTPIKDTELQSAKDYILGSMPLSLNSTESISSILLNLQGDDRPIDYLDHYPEKIKAITIEDVTRVANRILNTDKVVTVLVGQPEDITEFEELKVLPNVE